MQKRDTKEQRMTLAIAIMVGVVAVGKAASSTAPCEPTVSEVTLRATLSEKNYLIGRGVLQSLRADSCVSPGILNVLREQIILDQYQGVGILGRESSRVGALEAVARLGSRADSLRDTVFPLLGQGDDHTQLAAYKAAVGLGMRWDDLKEPWGKLAASKNKRIRLKTAEVSWGAGLDPEVVALVYRQSLQSDDIVELVEARDGLGRLGEPVIPILVQWLRHEPVIPFYAAWVHRAVIEPAYWLARVLPMTQITGHWLQWLIVHDPQRVSDDRSMIAGILGRMGLPAAAATGRLLDDPIAGPYAMSVLIAMPGQIVDQLDASIRSSPGFRRVIRGRISLNRADELMSALNSNDAEVRKIALQMLDLLVIIPESLAKPLLRLTTDPDFEIRLKAARLLVRAHGSETYIEPVLVEATQSVNPAERREALAELDRTNTLRSAARQKPLDQKELEQLVSRLSDTDPRIPWDAVHMIHRAGPGGNMVPMLIGLLDGPVSQAQSLACGLLGSFGKASRPAIPTLTRLIRQTNPRISRAAAETLARIGEPAYPSIIALMKDSNPNVQIFVLTGVPFCRPRTPALEAEVRRCLSASDPGVRMYAAESLRLWEAYPGEMPSSFAAFSE